MKISGYKVEISKLFDDEGGGYIATVPELPGCNSTGETQDEALAGIREAIEGWIVMSLRFDHEIPCPEEHSSQRASDKAHAA